MAIALDADFRSLKTGPKPEPAKGAPSASGHGETFANRLRQTREAQTQDVNPDTSEMAAVSYGGLAGPMHPAEPTEAAAPEEASLDMVATSPAVDAEASEVPVAPAQASVRKPEAPAPETVVPVTSAPEAPVDASADLQAPDSIEENAGLANEPKDLDVAPAQTTQGASAVPQPAIAAGDITGETATAVAAVTPAVPKAAATPEPTAQTAIPAAQAAKAGPQAAERAGQPDPSPVTAEILTPEISSDVAGLTTDKSAPVEPSGAVTATVSASLAVAGSAPAPASTPAATALPMTPTQAVITASPAQIVDIVAQSAEDGQSDRIVVQLDPPELGRVSIDFKFDATGLQQVTITSETPEAMRQLRQMHFELVQSLERQGLSSQNMTFQHQQQNAQQAPNPGAVARPALPGADADLLVASVLQTGNPSSTPRTLSGGRLDIRL